MMTVPILGQAAAVLLGNAENRIGRVAKRLPMRAIARGLALVLIAGLVWLFTGGGSVMRGFDDDLRAHLRAEMERRGISIITGRTVAGVDAAPGSFRVQLSDGAEVEVDKVMFATGRHPNVEGFGLDYGRCDVRQTRPLLGPPQPRR